MERTGCSGVMCGRALALAHAVLLAGCTMCPSPYDYSGPVPNGSAPQNDFRARSNGTRPLGSAPRPWPPIVKADPRIRGSGTPTLADPDAVLVADAPDDSVAEPVSILVPATAIDSADGTAAADVTATAATLVTPAEAPASEAPRTASDPGDAEAGALQIAPPEPLAIEMPSLAETPGWRPRQQP